MIPPQFGVLSTRSGPPTSWTTKAEPISASLTACASDNLSISVIVGGEQLATSTAGSPFAVTGTIEDLSITTVAYGDGLFVAAGRHATGTGRAVVSADGGQSWTAYPTGWGGGVVARIAYGGGVWVVLVGAAIWTASDPAGTWTQRLANAGSTLKDVAWSNGVWNACSSAAATIANSRWTSPDGLNWTSSFFSGANSTIPHRLAAINGTWMMVNESGQAYTSTDDGVTWAPVASVGSISRLAVSDQCWVAPGGTGGGSASRFIRVSPLSPIAWTTYQNPPTSPSFQWPRDGCPAGAGTWVVVTDGALLIGSP